jgi:hypothetical protein
MFSFIGLRKKMRVEMKERRKIQSVMHLMNTILISMMKKIPNQIQGYLLVI